MGHTPSKAVRVLRQLPRYSTNGCDEGGGVVTYVCEDQATGVIDADWKSPPLAMAADLSTMARRCLHPS
jgi:hypothetical protein